MKHPSVNAPFGYLEGKKLSKVPPTLFLRGRDSSEYISWLDMDITNYGLCVS